ncbi:MAG: hypothetical protein JXB38_00590 [Anaerolineales bacterium]|nr:hypothetical protein [Anaerolineales bacterium]
MMVTETLVPTHTKQQETETFTTAVTNTPTSTPSKTLEPGFSYDEAVESILYLLTINGDCTLPCWIGFTPGVSTRDDVNNFIHRYQSVIGGTRIYEEEQKIYVKIPPLPNGVTLEIIFEIGDNLVIAVNPCIHMTRPVGDEHWYTFDDPVFFEVTGAYRLDSILTQFGEPTDILFRSFKVGAQGFPSATQLYYHRKGVVVEYISENYGTVIDEAGRDTGQIITNPANGHVCFILLPENASLSPEYLNSNFLNGTEEWADQAFRPLEEVTNMTIDTFYKIYLTPHSQEYIFTDESLWPYNPAGEVK